MKSTQALHGSISSVFCPYTSSEIMFTLQFFSLRKQTSGTIFCSDEKNQVLSAIYYRKFPEDVIE
jgi:hypothetical protein